MRERFYFLGRYKLLILLSALIFVGCQHSSLAACPPVRTFSGNMAYNIDVALLDEPTCGPPCWYGLTPGVSSLEDANETLQSLDFVQSSSIRTATARGLTSLSWSSSSMGHQSMTFDEDDTLILIRSTIESPLSYDDLVSRIGEPVEYSTLINPSTQCYGLSLFWPEDGLAVETVTVPNLRRLNDSTQIARAIYFEAGPDVTGYIEGALGPISFLDDLKAWTSFEDVEFP